MRSIGLPELFVFGIIFFILPIVAIATIIRFMIKRGGNRSALASRICGACGQRVPDVGTFCAFCSRKVV
ncbi:MAG: hypothetical protein JWO48_1110 [Bryobacterales bacterium]|nr:hypothetical protein [Bryobacterales bacterium]